MALLRRSTHHFRHVLSLLAAGTLLVALCMPLLVLAADRELRAPVRLNFATDSNLLVADYLGRCIAVLHPDTLRVKYTIPVNGRPLSVAWTPGRYIVGNETAGAVEIHGRSGRLLYTLGDTGTVLAPLDIDVDRTLGLVFVVDGHAKAIKIFALDGPYIGSIGEDLLVHPVALAVDAEQEKVYVSDYGDVSSAYPAKVVVFDYAGQALGTVAGSIAGFSRPQGMTLDQDDHLYVVDSFLGQVLILEEETGEVLGVLGEFGSAPGELLLPLDVVYSAERSCIFVTNNRLGRIEVFQTGGE